MEAQTISQPKSVEKPTHKGKYMLMCVCSNRKSFAFYYL